ncbi:MAG: hypothetical protein ACE5HD_08775 [Acidobacteriota bacterium]
MRFWALGLVALLSIPRPQAGEHPPPSDNTLSPPAAGVSVYFTRDPLARRDLVLSGDPLARVTWHRDRPAFPGDRPGSLTALYDATQPAGLMGFALPDVWTQHDPFTALAVFVIRSERFLADPAGFFQISWGFWNSRTTGLNRTGRPDDFAGDAFELLEFDYFPNRSVFGGPFLSPTVTGAAIRDAPLFPLLGSFANFTFASVEVGLPLDTPLAALVEHRPGDGAWVVSVFRILANGRLLPLDGAVTVVPLDGLSLRQYQVDTLGLTLWHDGFTGDTPSVRATLTYHALLARPGVGWAPGVLLHAPAHVR